MIDFGGDGDSLDGGVEVADFLRGWRGLGVDGTGLVDYGDVHCEPG